MPHSLDLQKFSTQNAALSAEAAFKDGRKIKSITFIIDENPMPVAAAFRFGDNRERASLGLDIRLDQASPVCVAVEASGGISRPISPGGQPGTEMPT